MPALTESQQVAKDRVEAAGGVFVPPKVYRKNKGPIAKKASAVAQRRAATYYKPVYDELHPATGNLVDQILDPEESSDLQRWPNQYGLSGCYKCKNVLNANFDADGRSSVAVYPRLANSIFATAGVATAGTFPHYNTVDVFYPHATDLLSIKENIALPFAAPLMFPNNEAVFPFPNSQTSSLLYPLEITPAPGFDWSVRFKLDQSIAGSLTCVVVIYDAAFNNIFNRSAPVDVNGDAVLTFLSTDFPTCSYIRMHVISKYDYTGECVVSLVSEDQFNPWTYNLPNKSQHMTISDLKDSTTFYTNAQRYTVVAQSLLLTAQMSDTRNGGALAIARLPGETAVGSIDILSETHDNWYEYLASLPNNAYDGATKEGGYAWYLGENERAYFYRDVRNAVEYHMPFMASEFTVADITEGSIVRIKVTTIVQFTSNSSIFSMGPSEYIADWPRASYLLSLVPAAYGNATHKALIKKHLKTIGRKVLTMMKDPKTYKTAAKIGTGLAGLIL